MLKEPGVGARNWITQEHNKLHVRVEGTNHQWNFCTACEEGSCQCEEEYHPGVVPLFVVLALKVPWLNQEPLNKTTAAFSYLMSGTPSGRTWVEEKIRGRLASR